MKFICRFTYLIILSIFLVGCGSATKEIQNDESHQEEIDINELNNKFESVNEDKTEPIDINNFRTLKENFINYDFEVQVNGSLEEPISFLVSGEYDINRDGTIDTINLLLEGSYGWDEDVNTYLKINDKEVEIYMDYTISGEVKLVDLDKNDNFIELAYFDEGPSGDPHYELYRYDGVNIYHIGGIDSSALIDGEGRLISSFHISHFEPVFFSAWYEVVNNELVQKNNDIHDYLDKTYYFKGGEAFFAPSDEIIKGYNLPWEDRKQFDPCEIRLLDIEIDDTYRLLFQYFVELPNGEKGMLYFWIGD